jgi:ribosomal protein S18 acetylase RimI-like enzyme
MKNLIIKQLFRIGYKVIKEMEDIYLVSLPAEERIDFQKLLNAIKGKSNWLFVSEVNKSIAGFALVKPLVGTNIFLLRYIAVEPKLRNMGIGTAMLCYLKEKCGLQSTASGLIFEVESEVNAPPQEVAMRKRRLGFYKKNGAKFINCAPSYKMPNQATRGTINMKLMWIPLDGYSIEPKGQKLRNCIINIYTQAYDKQIDDPILMEILSSLKC